MRFRVLACDYDGTIAAAGVVAAPTLAALERVRRSGRKLLLVTGRTRSQLEAVFGAWDLFDRIVLENGALVVDPGTDEECLLCEPVSSRLVAELRRQGVEPLALGRAMCATTSRHGAAVKRVMDQLGLPLHAIVNRDWVMVLPKEVTKSVGVRQALLALGEIPEACVAVGDAENDVPMLSMSGCGVALADSLPVAQEAADLVTSRPDGAGVAELADQLVGDDLVRALVAARHVGAPRP